MQSRFLILALCTAATALAQVNSFPKASYFRETFKRTITKVELQAPVKLADFVVPAADGKKLELSLRSYLDLVMANNTDIAVSRLTVDVAQNAITRAFGPFDPLATGRFLATQSTTPASDQLQGATTLSTVQQPTTFGYTQLLSSGTSFTVGFNTLKSVSNSGFQTFNPTITSNMSVSFAQPLIKNRGIYINRLPITSARSRLRLTEYSFRDSVLQLMTNAENAYWDLVQARDFLAVQEKALALADAALKRSELELKLGAMSPLDIFNPQQNFATAEIGVAQARYLLQQREDALRKQIGADLDPAIRTLPIVLTETADVPADEPKLDTESQVQIALSNRPDLKAANQALDVDDLQIKTFKNTLLPDLSLLGLYTTQGRGGNFYQRGELPDGTTGLIGVIPGGFPDALSQMFGFGYPIYQFGLQLRLPIRNRSAAADLADSMVAKKRDLLAVRNVEQIARLNVVQAISQLESAKESVRLSLVALDFGRKYLEAEQKKYELGTSTIFFVLQANQALVNAESAVVQNKITYKRSVLNLWRQTGELLDRRGVAIQ
ncbi:MAG: TolC family protein [Candidatus Solibacter usitatus]|nr:TolC family protein [Candidatus Solibacter usitatus]